MKFQSDDTWEPLPSLKKEFLQNSKCEYCLFRDSACQFCRYDDSLSQSWNKFDQIGQKTFGNPFFRGKKE